MTAASAIAARYPHARKTLGLRSPDPTVLWAGENDPLELILAQFDVA